MKIILSPAKKMVTDSDTLDAPSLPVYIERSEEIVTALKSLDYDSLLSLWGCSPKIAEQNISRLSEMNLEKNLTPALLAYEGIAYQYMGPAVFEKKQYEYLENHLRILSAFYGILKPFDGVVPYRLEMQAKLSVSGHDDMYSFWGDSLYRALGDNVIINLASLEYSRCIEKYMKDDDIFITCVFGEEINGKVVQKGTYAKMARGDMVRFMAENNIRSPENIKEYNRMNYSFSKEHSTDSRYVFIRDRLR